MILWLLQDMSRRDDKESTTAGAGLNVTYVNIYKVSCD